MPSDLQHDARVPPEEAVSPIVPENEVTTSPAESSTFTTGCVENAEPDPAVTGEVVKTS